MYSRACIYFLSLACINKSTVNILLTYHLICKNYEIPRLWRASRSQSLALFLYEGTIFVTDICIACLRNYQLMSQINLCDNRSIHYPIFFSTFCTTCAPKNMSDPLSILKGEIKRLGFVSDEKISLFGYFTGNEKNQTDALSLLDDCDTDEERRKYLRSLISPPGMFFQSIR